MKLSLLPRQHLETITDQVALEDGGALGVAIVVDEPVVVWWCLHHADYDGACGISHRLVYILVLPHLS